MDNSGKIILDIAQELLDIWIEAKSTEADNWDDVTWDTLPEKQQYEYQLTAARIIEKVRAFYEVE